MVIIALTASFLAYTLYIYFYDNRQINFWNLIAIFEIPFLALSYLVISAKEKQDFHFASRFTKLMIVLGALSLFPFYYFFLL